MRAVRALVAGAVGLTLLAACGAPPRVELPSPDPVEQSASAELVAQRKAAGIADCPTSNLAATGPAAITLDCLGGDTQVNLAGLDRSRPAIINVWAQWCEPCRGEAPILADVSASLGDRVWFLGLDYADPRPAWAVDFASKYQMSYPQLADVERRSQATLRIAGQPQTLFVTTSGQLIVAKVGPWESREEFLDAVRKDLGVTV